MSRRARTDGLKPVPFKAKAVSYKLMHMRFKDAALEQGGIAGLAATAR